MFSYEYNTNAESLDYLMIDADVKYMLHKQACLFVCVGYACVKLAFSIPLINAPCPVYYV